MKYIGNTLIITGCAIIIFIAGFQIGWNTAEKQHQPDHQIVETQIGKIMIQNKKLYAIDEVHTLVVDPVLLNQLTAKSEKKK